MPWRRRPGLTGPVLPRALKGLTRLVKSSQQGEAPEAEDAGTGPGLAEQPEVQDGGGGQTGDGCVSRQLLEPAR